MQMSAGTMYRWLVRQRRRRRKNTKTRGLGARQGPHQGEPSTYYQVMASHQAVAGENDIAGTEHAIDRQPTTIGRARPLSLPAAAHPCSLPSPISIDSIHLTTLACHNCPKTTFPGQFLLYRNRTTLWIRRPFASHNTMTSTSWACPSAALHPPHADCC